MNTRKFVRKLGWVLPSILISGLTVTIIHQQLNRKQEMEDIPGNPGWQEQWQYLKQNANGEVDYDLYNQVRNDVDQVRLLRSGALFSNVTERGPNNVGGRTRALWVDYADSSRIFAGGVSGGLWISTNSGQLWSPVNDGQATLSITSITQSPFDYDVLYYSNGEIPGNSAGIPGNGIYKSTDGGQSFNLLPSTNNGLFNYTWQITHSLTDTNEVFVGTWTEGLWQTNNGGTTWTNVLPDREITDSLLQMENPDLHFLIYDGARPCYVQEVMYNMVKKMPVAQGLYLSHPVNHSLHNYGAAVDLTLCDNQGNPVDMGTPFDHFGVESHIGAEFVLVEQGKITQEAYNNRKLLRRIMMKAGFTPITFEWWHFNSCSRGYAAVHYTLLP